MPSGHEQEAASFAADAPQARREKVTISRGPVQPHAMIAQTTDFGIEIGDSSPLRSNFENASSSSDVSVRKASIMNS
jgi:hypothetical protein